MIDSLDECANTEFFETLTCAEGRALAMPRQATGSPRWNATESTSEARFSEVPGHDCVPVAMPGIGPCAREKPCSLKSGADRCANCAAAVAMALLVVKRAREIGAVPVESKKVVREWFDEWIDDRVRRGLTSTRDDRSHFVHHVNDVLGALPMPGVTRSDLEGLIESLDRKVQDGKLWWKSALNVWATVSKMFDDAANAKSRALRIRDDNPAENVRGPDRGNDRAKQFLFPSEVVTFMAHRAVPPM